MELFGKRILAVLCVVMASIFVAGLLLWITPYLVIAVCQIAITALIKLIERAAHWVGDTLEIAAKASLYIADTLWKGGKRNA